MGAGKLDKCLNCFSNNFENGICLDCNWKCESSKTQKSLSDNFEVFNIKTGFEIYNFIANDITDVEEENHPYQEKWILIKNIIRRINHIKDVIRQCSWEDELGEQTLHYSDLHNLFKILEGELNKPEVNKPSLSQNNNKEDGIPPTNKNV